jgi:hypothetical protein
MKPTCDEIRERAFHDGLDSPAAAEWRAHCRSCPDCRTELFILENLERQAVEDRQHLGRDEVQKLLDTARSQPRRHRANPLLVWGLRAACVAALLIVSVGLFPGEFASQMRTRVQAWFDGKPLPDAPESLLRMTRANQPQTLPNQPVPAAATVPAADLDRQLRLIRDRVDRRRESLQHLLERDFGPFSPEDACYAPSCLAIRNA